MISEFVGRSKLMRTSPSNSRFWIPWAAAPCPAAGAGAGAGAAPPRDRDPPRAALADRDLHARDRAQRLRQLVAVRVLAVVDVDAPVAALDRPVELLDHALDPLVRTLGGDDDQLIRALVRDDLGDDHLGGQITDLRPARPRCRRRGGAPAPFFSDLLHLEDLAQLLRHVGGGGVLQADDPDLLARARLIDLRQHLQHAFDVGREVRDDQRVLGREHDDVALLALDPAQHLRHLVRIDVFDVDQAGHVALAARNVGVLAVDRDAAHGLDLGGLDDALEPARVLDGQAGRIERPQEQPVRLLGRDQLGRHDGHLLAVGRNGAGQQELLAGDRRDPGDQIAELGVRLQIQLHDALAGRELLAGVEVLVADQLVRARDAGRPAGRRARGRRRRRPARRGAGVVGAAPGAGGPGRGPRLPPSTPGRPGIGGVRGVPGAGDGVAPGVVGADSPGFTRTGLPSGPVTTAARSGLAPRRIATTAATRSVVRLFIGCCSPW